MCAVTPPGPIDRMLVWRESMRQFQEAASSAAGQSDLARQFMAPLRAQAELFEQVLQRQEADQSQLLQGLIEPLRGQVEFLAGSAQAMREQAEVFESAAESLARGAALMRIQAGLFERATEPLRRQAEWMDGLTGASSPPTADG